MGLDAFKTDSGSSSESTKQKLKSKNDESDTSDTSKSSSNKKSSLNDRPYFTVVKDSELRQVTTHKGKSAFPKRGRYRTETIIQIIESEEEYDRLDEKAQRHHGVKLPDFFKQDHALAKDFTERLSLSSGKSENPTCDVCGGEIDITEGNYTKIEDSPVHGDHNILNVLQALEVGDYGS